MPRFPIAGDATARNLTRKLVCGSTTSVYNRYTLRTYIHTYIVKIDRHFLPGLAC